MKKVIVRDKEAFEVIDYDSPFEAIGQIDIGMSVDRVDELIQNTIPRLATQRKIKGHVIMYDGGEFEMKDFDDMYQAIGFMLVNLSEPNVRKMKNIIWKGTPEKFKDKEPEDDDRESDQE